MSMISPIQNSELVFSYVYNRPVAVGTFRSEYLVVVLFTVGLSVPLVEVLGSQREVTVSTGKVLNMPHLSQGRDHLENSFKFKTTNLDIPILNHLSINSKSNAFINKSKLLK